jgi:hypothetical protein
MTKNEYLNLSGEYCIKMGWNHDAIPELAECLERHDKNITRFLEGEKIARQYAIDKGVELQRENARLDKLSVEMRKRWLEVEESLTKIDAERFKLWEAVIITLAENRHLADGENCTLIELKRAVPDWESFLPNVQAQR